MQSCHHPLTDDLRVYWLFSLLWSSVNDVTLTEVFTSLIIVNLLFYSTRILIRGFGSPSQCLVAATIGEQYVLSVSVDGHNISLWYDGISSPAFIHPARSLQHKRASEVTCKYSLSCHLINY